MKRDAVDKVRARRKSPEYDPLLAAVCDVCGIVRADLSLEERADFNELVSSLIRQGATPRTVRHRGVALQQQFPGLRHLAALEEHWPKLGHPSGYRDTVNVPVTDDRL